MSENPYQSPAVSEVESPPLASRNAKLIRDEHLHCEASLKGMGTLFLLGSLLLLLAVCLMVGDLKSAGGQGGDFVAFVVFLGLIPLQVLAWWGLRGLRPWAKVPAGVLSLIGLMALGLGTIISIYFLYLLFGKKGRMVLSPVYQEIILQTPGMKYHTPRWNWIVLGIMLVLVVGTAVYVMNIGW